MATYPQGQVSEIFFPRAVCAQKGCDELGHSSDSRGDLLVSLVLSGSDRQMIRYNNLNLTYNSLILFIFLFF